MINLHVAANYLADDAAQRHFDRKWPGDPASRLELYRALVAGEGRCAVSGLELRYGRGCRSPSLLRLDTRFGLTVENVLVVAAFVAAARQQYPLQEIVQFWAPLRGGLGEPADDDQRLRCALTGHPLRTRSGSAFTARPRGRTTVCSAAVYTLIGYDRREVVDLFGPSRKLLIGPCAPDPYELL